MALIASSGFEYVIYAVLLLCTNLIILPKCANSFLRSSWVNLEDKPITNTKFFCTTLNVAKSWGLKL